MSYISWWRKAWMGFGGPWGNVVNLFVSVVVGGGLVVPFATPPPSPVYPPPQPGEGERADSGSPIAIGPIWDAERYEIPSRYWAASGNVETVVTHDEEGRSTKMRIHTLSQDFSWVADGSDLVELEDGREGTKLLRSRLRGMSAPGGRLHRAKELVVVGAASCERGCKDEYELAMRRATQLAGWVGEARPDLGLHRLVLGGWKSSAEQCRGYGDFEKRRQRRVLILEIERDDGGPLQRETLEEAMAISRSLAFETSDYCAFDLDPPLD